MDLRKNKACIEKYGAGTAAGSQRPLRVSTVIRSSAVSLTRGDSRGTQGRSALAGSTWALAVGPGPAASSACDLGRLPSHPEPVSSSAKRLSPIASEAVTIPHLCEQLAGQEAGPQGSGGPRSVDGVIVKCTCFFLVKTVIDRTMGKRSNDRKWKNQAVPPAAQC